MIKQSGVKEWLKHENNTPSTVKMYLFEDKETKNVYFLFKNNGDQIYDLKLKIDTMVNLQGDPESSLMIYGKTEQVRSLRSIDKDKEIKYHYEIVLKPV